MSTDRDRDHAQQALEEAVRLTRCIAEHARAGRLDELLRDVQLRGESLDRFQKSAGPPEQAPPALRTLLQRYQQQDLQLRRHLEETRLATMRALDSLRSRRRDPYRERLDEPAVLDDRV